MVRLSRTSAAAESVAAVHRQRAPHLLPARPLQTSCQPTFCCTSKATLRWEQVPHLWDLAEAAAVGPPLVIAGAHHSHAQRLAHSKCLQSRPAKTLAAAKSRHMCLTTDPWNQVCLSAQCWIIEVELTHAKKAPAKSCPGRLTSCSRAIKACMTPAKALWAAANCGASGAASNRRSALIPVTSGLCSQTASQSACMVPSCNSEMQRATSTAASPHDRLSGADMFWIWVPLGQAQVCSLSPETTHAVEPMACSKVSVQPCICQRTEHPYI